MADIKTVQLIVNSEQAKSKIAELNKQLDVAKQKKLDAFKVGDAKGIEVYSKEIQKLERQLTKAQTRGETITKTLKGLDKATPNELKRTIRELTKELNSGKIERGSKEWEALNEALRECNGELKKIKEESKAAEGTLKDAEKGIAGFGNKWVGLIGSIQMGWDILDKVRNSMGEYVSAYLDMAEAESQVIKYTGMTTEEVKELNEAFKKMDTRTSREQLNALAGDAGRLGITGKQGVLDFVEAADMINVALGEDLGEDAVKNIGKLAQLFGDDDKMGLKQAMLSTGSVINHLGSISSASESYIVDFTGRLSSMAATAKMSQADVMGLAAVLDQGMVQSEQASTALSSIIQKLHKDTSGMASAVGLNVQEFATLLKTDANEALMTWLDAVNKMGGMDVIAPLLGELKLSGAGVSKTIATLAGNIDLVRTTQEEANKAFQEGTSILSEVEKANNTPLAQQEKLQKQLHDLKVQLGEELYPVWQAGMGLTSQMVSLLSTLISFLGQYWKQILVVVTAMSSYKLVTLASIAITKSWVIITKGATAIQLLWNRAIALGEIVIIAFRHGINAARIAMIAFNVATKANPIGLFLTVIASVTALVWAFVSSTEEATEAMVEMADEEDAIEKAHKRAAEAMLEEKTKVEELKRAIDSETTSYEDKRKAMLELEKIVPGFHANIDEEITLTEENTTAINNYIAALEKKALAEAAYEQILEIQRKKMPLLTRQLEIKADYLKNKSFQISSEKALKDVVEEQNNPRVAATDAITDNRIVLGKKVNVNIITEYEGIEQQLKAYDDQLTTLRELREGFLPPSISLNDDDDDDDDDPQKDAAQKAKDVAELERLKATLLLKTGEVTQEQYKEMMIKAEEDLYAELSKIYPEGTKERIDAQLDCIEAVKKHNKTFLDWSIHDIERQEREEQQVLKRKYADGEISEKEYRDALTNIQASYLRRKAAFAKKEGNTEASAQYTAQAEEAELQQELQRRQQFEQQAQRMQQQYLQKSIAERRQAENDLLTELIHAGVIAEEKEQDYRDAIKKKFDEEEKNEKKDEKKDDKWGNIGGQMDPMTSSIVNVMTAMDNLSQKIKDGKADWGDYAGAAIGALGMVSATMQVASNYMQACYQAEEAKVTKRYDAEIKAAGENTKKGKQLEEKKQKELATLKAKYNKKAMTIEIAQAVASTAMAAINAYASAAKVNFILGPIAAAAATAAGMLQIATIKKQHEAQAAGYYEGGFTGGNSYRREAGVVHQGEFVANHKAVNNPNVLPVLKMLDYAQRNNTIASVTSADIANATGGGAGQTVVAPVVVHETERTSQALERLNENLEHGTLANIVIEDFDRMYRRYQNLMKRGRG